LGTYFSVVIFFLREERVNLEYYTRHQSLYIIG